MSQSFIDRDQKRQLRDIAQDYTLDALKTLAEIMYDKSMPPPCRIVAAKSLLDRGLGRPVQMSVNYAPPLDVSQVDTPQLLENLQKFKERGIQLLDEIDRYNDTTV